MESPWTAMLAPGVISRPRYTEVAIAEAGTLSFWLLLRVKVRLDHPGTHEHDRDASSNCLCSSSLLVAGRMQDPAIGVDGLLA